MKILIIADIPSHFPISAYASQETNWLGNNSFWDLMSWTSHFQNDGHSTFLLNGHSTGVAINFKEFDLLFIHYSAGFQFDNFKTGRSLLTKQDIEKINSSRIKVLVSFQDEYRNVKPRQMWLSQFSKPIVLTVSSKEASDIYYPGHVVMNLPLAMLYPDITNLMLKYGAEKPVDVFYRGRPQPLARGEIGQTKNKIDIFVANMRKIGSLNLDISNEEKDRVYGTRYFEKLGKSRFVICSPSGSSHSFNHDFQELLHSNQTISLIAKKDPNLYNVSIAEISPRVIESVLAGAVILGVEMDNLLEGYGMLPGHHFLDLEDITKAALQDEKQRLKMAKNALDCVLKNAPKFDESYNYVMTNLL